MKIGGQKRDQADRVLVSVQRLFTLDSIFGFLLLPDLFNQVLVFFCGTNSAGHLSLRVALTVMTVLHCSPLGFWCLSSSGTHLKTYKRVDLVGGRFDDA